MSLPREVVYENLFIKKLGPIPVQPNVLFNTINNNPKGHTCQFMDRLAQESLLEHCDYSWKAKDKRITVKCQYFDEIEKELEHTGAFNLICEENVAQLIVSKHLYETIYFKQPFICYAAVNYHKHLQTLGFKLYDNLIDYSFDSIENAAERLNELLKQIKVLTRYRNFDRLQNILKSQNAYNFNVMWHIINNENNATLCPQLNTLQKFKKLI
jgi:hypothetical protein|tara:strand:- start:89 stop:724 length:636 start_codon:yes stop_codon:yes gene_type:complete